MYRVSSAANRAYPNKNLFTLEDFRAFMPQFFKKSIKKDVNGVEYEDFECLVPEAYMDDVLNRVNQNILECRWFEKWKWASALYVAHYSTIYLRTYKDSSDNINQAAQSGTVTGNVSSSSLGDTSVSYDNSVVNQSLSEWGAWATTQYGIQLVNEAKLLGMGGAYFI